MSSIPCSRRLVLAGAVAALVPMRDALAQAGGADWMAMVRAHHALIARSFEELLGDPGRTFLARDRLIQAIGYQLTAHSVAEENVIYPALAMAGMESPSDKLYLDQAHAKVMNAQMALNARTKRESPDWLAPARALQAAVMRHAIEDEERSLYPQLVQKLSPEQNAFIADSYRRQFASIEPPRGLPA